MALRESPALLYGQMRQAFDGILPHYNREVPFRQREDDYPPVEEGTAYLRTHLAFLLTGACIRAARVLPTRSGQLHTIVRRKNANDYRLALPSTIHRALQAFAEQNPGSWCSANVTATWVACYLSGKHPNEAADGWEGFECSHRCAYAVAGWMCVTPECLVWESKAVNQSRGQDLCIRLCRHASCGMTVCECNGLHEPCCL